MAKGFLSGVIWGGVVSLIGAGTVSVLASSPQSPEAEIEAPSGAVAPQEGVASDASATRDADIVRNGALQDVTSPEADTTAAASAAGSDTPVVPEAGAADDLPDVVESPQEGAVRVGDVSPVSLAQPSQAPTAPFEETALSISTDPAQPAIPSVPETPTAFSPDVPEVAEVAPTAPIAEAPAPQTPEVAQAPNITDAPEAPGADLAATDTPEPESEAPETESYEVAEAPAAAQDTAPPLSDTPAEAAQSTDGLPNVEEPAEEVRPRIGRPSVSLVDRTPDAPAPEETAPEVENATLEPPLTEARAILAHAAPFENPDDKPLMAIVLIDSGVDLSGGSVDLAALRSFPYPLTFAVDASLSDAGTRMSNYRAEEFEVMALIDLPQGATATDAEVSLSAAIDAVPEAVAIMEGTGIGVQETRDTGDQIAQAVLATGHGLVLQSKGLNTAQKLAAREGVPAGLVFRDFDSADQNQAAIRRFLDQAAFRAGQEGGVIMVGRVRSETISALLLWGLQDRAQRVALAPISAVLTALVAPQ